MILGPTFLHWDGSYTTYCEFLSKLRAVLGFGFPTEKIVFGADEERALVNAIQTCFSNSKTILCTRHLEENAKRNFQKLEIPENTKAKILAELFGSNGILTVELRFMFIEKQQEIIETYGNIGGRYLCEKLLPLLFRHVFFTKT